MILMKYNVYFFQLFQALFLSFLVISCKNQPKGIDWEYLTSGYSDKKDSVKLEAVYFLRDNMDDLTSQIPKFYDSTGENEIILKWDTISSDASLKKIVAQNKYQYKLQMKYDTAFVTTELIKNAIEESYAMWKQNPWKMDISKDIFLNYLLPYKILKENPERWRTYFYNRFSSALIYKDSVNDVSLENKRHQIDLGIEKEVIKNDTAHIFSSNMDVAHLTLSPGLSELIAIKSGDCFSETNKNIYLYRALGIPAAFDFTPAYGGGNAGHSTAVFWDDYLKKFTPKYSQGFNPTYMLAKAFRYSFKKQNIFKDSILPIAKISENFCIDELKNDHWFDVTDEHIVTKDISIPIKRNDVSFGYICTYSYGKWLPIFWEKIANNTISFIKMGLGVLYQIALPKGNTYELTNNIFLLDSNGLVKQFIPDFQKRTSVTLERINYGSEAGVKKGSSYTLKYLAKTRQWVNQETRTASKDNYIKFDNIPTNTVYMLFSNDPKSRRLERPFLYSNVHWLRWL